MTAFLFPYALFLAKTVTWGIALLVIAIVVFGLVRDARSSGGPERLEVRNLNRRFEHLADTVRDEILAGAHLGDLAHVQDHAADQLDIEMAHPEHPHRGFTADREGLRQHLVQRLALGDALAEL